MPTRRHVLRFAAATVALPGAALAHHGWRWASAETFVLEGTLRSVRLGNPHGEAQVETAEGALWLAELGQPWRHAEAGLRDDLLVPGTALTLEGHRSADPQELRMKAERVILGGVLYDLYPGRS
jgi:hypothetical protein